MNTPAAEPLVSKSTPRAPGAIRSPELGPALKRDQLLSRVRAARKRLSQAPPGALAKLR